MVELDAEYRDKGLHIITSYDQFQEFKVIQGKVDELKIEFPVALDGFFESRFRADLLCRVWVIGADGKVVHAHKDGWEQAAQIELKKVRYPMLGRTRVRSDVKEAAQAFGEGRYAEAQKLATAISDGEYSDNAIEDADYILDRIDEMVDTLSRRADVHEICGRYELAVACWKELAWRFQGVEELKDPDKELERIRQLDDFESELKARHAYVAVRLKAWALFGAVGDDKTETRNAALGAAKVLRGFVEEFPEAAVADSARDLARRYDEWAKQLQDSGK